MRELQKYIKRFEQGTIKEFKKTIPYFNNLVNYTKCDIIEKLMSKIDLVADRFIKFKKNMRQMQDNYE